MRVRTDKYQTIFKAVNSGVQRFPSLLAALYLEHEVYFALLYRVGHQVKAIGDLGEFVVELVRRNGYPDIKTSSLNVPEGLQYLKRRLHDGATPDTPRQQTTQTRDNHQYDQFQCH